MSILVDECVSRKFCHQLREHDCVTVQEAGFAGAKNGRLLDMAEASGFDLLVTIDRGIYFQQSFQDRRIAVLILRAVSNRLVDLVALKEGCLSAIETIRPGDVVVIGQ